MENMTLVTVLLVSWGLAVGQSTGVQYTEQASVGDSVVLHCQCSGMPPKLVWQTGDKVVIFYPPNAYEKSSIDKAYINRTELFLHMDNSNCSLLLHNASLKDSGVYTCYDVTKVDQGISSQKPLNINLTVYEPEKGSQDIRKGGESKDLSSVQIGVPILAVVVILAAGLLLTLMLIRRRQKQSVLYTPATVPGTDV